MSIQLLSLSPSEARHRCRGCILGRQMVLNCCVIHPSHYDYTVYIIIFTFCPPPFVPTLPGVASTLCRASEAEVSVAVPLIHSADLGYQLVHNCDETEPRWPLHALGRRMERSTAWNLSKTGFISSHTTLLYQCSRHISRSTDLYLQIYRSVSLHGHSMLLPSAPGN